MRTFLKAAIRSWLQSRGIYVFRKLPRGVDPLTDLAELFSQDRDLVMVDVGANVGQTSSDMLRHFPRARVHSVEPASSNYDALRQMFANDTRVTAHRMALGSSTGEATLSLSEHSTMHRIDASQTDARHRQEVVPLDTLDRFAATNGLDRVDFLKIDTEGHDLEVLKGSAALLSRTAIAAVLCECGMHPDNTSHTSFEEIKAFMERSGYRIFGVYEQVTEWCLERPYLRRVNSMYVPADIAISTNSNSNRP